MVKGGDGKKETIRAEGEDVGQNDKGHGELRTASEALSSSETRWKNRARTVLSLAERPRGKERVDYDVTFIEPCVEFGDKSEQNQLPLLSLEDEDVGSMSARMTRLLEASHQRVCQVLKEITLIDVSVWDFSFLTVFLNIGVVILSANSPGANVSSVRMKLKTTEADLLNDKEYLISAIKLEVEQNLSVDRGRISIIIRSKSKGVINVEIQISDDEQQSLAMKLLSSIQEGSCRGNGLGSTKSDITSFFSWQRPFGAKSWSARKKSLNGEMKDENIAPR
eukprot:747230-Hanusia_phi.AAC.1